MRARARAGRGPAARATDGEVSVVAAVVAAGSEKAGAHRLRLSHSTVKHHLANARFKVGAATTAQLVWILAPRLPAPDDKAHAEERLALQDSDAFCGFRRFTQASPTLRSVRRGLAPAGTTTSASSWTSVPAEAVPGG